ncbi:branched-chain amino acid aminotransferase [Mesorhizobium sp. J18]|uniref:branched-chain-amino-acid transaminase n=1 Tax=Mesorhizobium sp. J18 TaxID=935263 RepID=UPI00119A1F9D|nr:branched-chain-amino-acid transaminase [Mesorhizobium sp. J18]TWG96411.1 branched-chain amino acid aminotransferase [Mesorhizobium sp. J18]
MSKPKYIMMNGELVPFDDAKIHVLAPAVTYAMTVFEGIRAYWTEEKQELYLFRLDEHLLRLRQSVKAMRFDADLSVETMRNQIIELIRANGHRENIHLRVMALVEGSPSVSSVGPVSLVITAGAYPSTKWVDSGMNVQVSSWQRVGDTTNPPRIKATANYSNGRFAMLQAQQDGYDSAIMLTRDGKVAETPVATVLLVRRGEIVAPGVTEGILESITRDTIIQLAHEGLDMKVVERPVDRTELYAADEVFACGSGWEVTPIATIDRIPVGIAAPGPITRRLRELYMDEVHGRGGARHPEWLTPVWQAKS